MSPVNSPHKDQWRGALVFSLICARINGWVNNREASDLRRHRTHYNVTVMAFSDRSNTGNHDGIFQHWQWYLPEIHKYIVPISFQHICQFWWYSWWMVKDFWIRVCIRLNYWKNYYWVYERLNSWFWWNEKECYTFIWYHHTRLLNLHEIWKKWCKASCL